MRWSCKLSQCKCHPRNGLSGGFHHFYVQQAAEKVVRSALVQLDWFGVEPSNRCPGWSFGGCANVGVVAGRPLLRVHRTVGVGVGSCPPCWRNRRVGVVGWPPCWECRPSFLGFRVGFRLVVLWVLSNGFPKPFVGFGLDNCGNRWRVVRFVVV